MQMKPIHTPTSPERLLQVRVTLGAAPGGMEHFTPGGSMRWGQCQFHLNPPDGGHYDFWIVFGNALGVEQASVAPANTLFIAGEPPAKKTYPLPFYRQFAHVVDTHAGSKHPGLIISALGLCWLVGLDFSKMRFKFGYDHLKRLPRPEKENKIGVVCSATAKTSGQRARLRFLKSVKQILGDRIVHYGKGFEPIDDKLDAIAPYRFHLVLENSQSPHYWTEKLTDAYLGWAYPFYIGCPDLETYFESAAFTPVSLEYPEAAAALMAAALEDIEGPDEIAAVGRARARVLEEYNPFARFDHWVGNLHQKAEPEIMTILSAKKFSISQRLRSLFVR